MYNFIVANFRNADQRTSNHAKLMTAFHWAKGGNETFSIHVSASVQQFEPD